MSVQSDAVKSIYQTELGAAIDTIFSTKAYTDILALKTQGLIEAEFFNDWLISFTKEAFFTAEKFSFSLAMIDPNKDLKSNEELSILQQNKANLEQEHAIRQERRVMEVTLLAKEVLSKEAQIESEQARKLVLTKQGIGFDDNVVIKNAQVVNETIGMIQSGGNEAPTALWTQQNTAMSRLEIIAGKHEEL